MPLSPPDDSWRPTVVHRPNWRPNDDLASADVEHLGLAPAESRRHQRGDLRLRARCRRRAGDPATPGACPRSPSRMEGRVDPKALPVLATGVVACRGACDRVAARGQRTRHDLDLARRVDLDPSASSRDGRHADACQRRRGAADRQHTPRLPRCRRADRAGPPRGRVGRRATAGGGGRRSQRRRRGRGDP